jgi:hypothetical protein
MMQRVITGIVTVTGGRQWLGSGYTPHAANSPASQMPCSDAASEALPPEFAHLATSVQLRDVRCDYFLDTRGRIDEAGSVMVLYLLCSAEPR